MDRTPGIPGFDKNNLMCMLQTLIAITMMILMMLIMMIINGSHCDDNSYLSKIKWPFSNMNPFRTFSHGFQFWEQRSAGQSAVLTLMDLQIETQIGRNWKNSSRHNSTEKYFVKKYFAEKYSAEKYSTEIYSTKKYSSKKYTTNKYSAGKYSTEKYSMV